MKGLATASTLALLLTSAALAGDVKGTVKMEVAKPDEISKDSEVVVWIDGVKDFETPTDEIEIAQKDITFNPKFTVAVVGQTVSWPNEDKIAHNVFSKSEAKEFNLGIYPKGQTRKLVFDKPGAVDVRCNMHRKMHMVVLVVPNPYFAITRIDGDYEIAGVPAGEYDLKVWHKDFGIIDAQRVSVTDGEVPAVVTLKK